MRQISFLIQLSENDKRIIYVFLLALILVIALASLIGWIITRVMKAQGKRMNNLVSDVIVTYTITERKKFLPYARKKNYRLYFKQSWIPLLLLITGGLIWLITYVTKINKGISYNPFSNDEFGTLLFIWDWNDVDSYTQVFFLKVLAKWPPLISSPHFDIKALSSYFIVPFITVGGAWYLFVTQAFISRTINMYKIANKQIGTSGNLESFSQSQAFGVNQTNNQQNNNSNNINQ